MNLPRVCVCKVVIIKGLQGARALSQGPNRLERIDGLPFSSPAAAAEADDMTTAKTRRRFTWRLKSDRAHRKSPSSRLTSQSGP